MELLQAPQGKGQQSWLEVVPENKLQVFLGQTIIYYTPARTHSCIYAQKMKRMHVLLNKTAFGIDIRFSLIKY